MKKKLVIVVIIGVFIATVAYFSQPKDIINDKNSYDIFRVVYNGVDVTEQVDCEALASIVSKYKRSRLPHAYAPYQLSQVVVELDGVTGNGLLHIMLGDINIACGSGNRGFSIKNSDALLAEILNIMPYLTDEDRGLKESDIITFSDGESVDLWRSVYGGRDIIYKLSDETTLLTIQDPSGPDNVYVGGQESYDDLSETAQKAVSAFYEKQGVLYDTQSELEKAYAEYLACKESGTEYHERHISQDIVPIASNDTIMCFNTSVILPVGGYVAQELRLNTVFNRETGAVIRTWDLFKIPEREARQLILDAFDVEEPLRAEMKAALKPEYISLSSENLSVTFPPGTLPSQEYGYGFGVKYSKLKDVLHPWAIPN